jgi:hypothetical protein
MSAITSFLPPFDGLLPKWLLLVSVIAFGNSIQAYTTLHYTRRLYSGVPPAAGALKQQSAGSASTGSPVTPLSARTFGTWTFQSSLLRLYAAYHLDNPIVYQLCLWTYVIAFAHFASEWRVFRTTSLNVALAGPLIVSTLSLVWMWVQWDYYVRP